MYNACMSLQDLNVRKECMHNDSPINRSTVEKKNMTHW